MLRSLCFLGIVTIVPTLCATLQIASASTASTLDYPDLRLQLCSGSVTNQDIPEKKPLRSDQKVSNLHKQEWIKGGDEGDDIEAIDGIAKGCYNGGPGNDKIYISGANSDKKYVQDSDGRHGDDQVICKAGKRPLLLIIEARVRTIEPIGCGKVDFVPQQ